MIISKIISKSKNGNRMEVIGKDNKGVKKTLHIRKKASNWVYQVGLDDKESPKLLIIKEKKEVSNGVKI